ncbi:MAG: PEGA domain-containing protein [Bacteroidales bacterium]|nr:PEGA domain-containing protein [Bacteroidales bacterium]
MRRFLPVLLALLFPLLAHAQINMSILGQAELDPEDNDARSYYAARDVNDNYCAIIKVSLSNPVSGTLVLTSRGGMATVKTEKQANGEWWFWVSPVVTNIMFSCEGYTPTAELGVQVKAKSVYRLKLKVDAAVAMVTTYTMGDGAMKLDITPPDVTVFYGKTEACDIGSKKLTDGLFSMFLEKGTYYYRIENRYYETATGKYEVTDNSKEVSVSLKPAFSYLNLDSNPHGAEVYIGNRLLGVTPIEKSDRVRKGESIRLEFRKEDYYIEPVSIKVAGDGEAQIVPTVTLRPQFGWVTFECDDPLADITVTSASNVVAKGHSGMRVKLNSGGASYKIEASRASHISQSQGLKGSAIEGKDIKISVEKPVPICGGLQITSTPSRAKVFIDGVESGTTAFSKTVLVGTHKVELRLDGYHLDPFNVTIEEGKTIQVSKALIAGPRDGTLNITTGDLTGVTLNINGDGVSKTSKSPARVTVPAGSYQITANKYGYKTARTNATVKEELTTNVNLKMRKEPMRWKWSTEETGFSSMFMDLNLGFLDGDTLWGLHYVSCKKHLGFYLRFLALYYLDEYYDIEAETGSFSLGPVIRLTSDSSKVDWQIYGGIGFMYEAFGGEVGTRFSWPLMESCSFNLSFGVQMYNDGFDKAFIPVFGIGLGI